MRKKDRRQGRTGAGERGLRRAHARRLLWTLVEICRHLRRQHPDEAVRSAYGEVESALVRLAKGGKA